jgi:4-hydroxy-4-methyl-2-oxoglutarate aldolase
MQPAPPIDPAVLASLKRYDTPTLLNVIELLNLWPRDQGYTDNRIRALYPEFPPAVGYAVTATFRSSRPEDGEPKSYAGFVEQVASFVERVPAPRIVVFQDLDGIPVGATFGEVMCSVYQAFGCVGLVTSGAARDVEQVRRIGFPCWATSVIASHAYCRITSFDVDVEVGGLAISTGDLIHADGNGVARIPRDIAPRIAARLANGCERFVAAENLLLDRVRTPGVDLALLRDARRSSTEAFARIAADLKIDAGP